MIHVKYIHLVYQKIYLRKNMNEELLHVSTLEDTYVSVKTVTTKIFKT